MDTHYKMLYFTAPWCTACKSVKPLVEQVENTEVEIIDVSTRGDLAEKYGVQSLPTLILLYDETPVRVVSGAGNTMVDLLKDFA